MSDKHIQIHQRNADNTAWDILQPITDPELVVDNLTSEAADKALSAKQGKVLSERVQGLDEYAHWLNEDIRNETASKFTQTGKNIEAIRPKILFDNPTGSYLTFNTPITFSEPLNFGDLIEVSAVINHIVITSKVLIHQNNGNQVTLQHTVLWGNTPEDCIEANYQVVLLLEDFHGIKLGSVRLLETSYFFDEPRAPVVKEVPFHHAKLIRVVKHPY